MEVEELTKEKVSALTKFLRAQLKDRVERVMVSKRLTTSPAAMVTTEHGTSANQERINRAQALGQGMQEKKAKKVMEINPNHPIIIALSARLEEDAEDEVAVDLAELLYETSHLQSGFVTDDPASYASRIYRFLKLRLDLDEEAEAVVDVEADLHLLDEEDATVVDDDELNLEMGIDKNMTRLDEDEVPEGMSLDGDNSLEAAALKMEQAVGGEEAAARMAAMHELLAETNLELGAEAVETEVEEDDATIADDDEKVELDFDVGLDEEDATVVDGDDEVELDFEVGVDEGDEEDATVVDDDDEVELDFEVGVDEEDATVVDDDDKVELDFEVDLDDDDELNFGMGLDQDELPEGMSLDRGNTMESAALKMQQIVGGDEADARVAAMQELLYPNRGKDSRKAEREEEVDEL